MFNELIFLLEISFLFLCTLVAAKKGELYLAALICLESVFANLFVLKQITLFGLKVTASDCFAVGGVMALSVFQEYFGKEKAKKVVTCSLLTLVFFAVSSFFHLQFLPSEYDWSHSYYKELLHAGPRITMASFVAFFLSQKTDLHIFSFLKRKFTGLSLGIRSGLSTTLAQVVDTLTFSFLGLYGLVSNLGDIFLLSLLIKLSSIFCFSSFLILFKKTLQKSFKGA